MAKRERKQEQKKKKKQYQKQKRQQHDRKENSNPHPHHFHYSFNCSRAVENNYSMGKLVLKGTIIALFPVLLLFLLFHLLHPTRVI
jgi:hypothetical protein